MSTDLSNDPGRQPPSVFKSTALAIGSCMLLAVVLYFIGGKAIIENRKVANHNQIVMKEISDGLAEAEVRDNETQSVISALQERIVSGNVTTKELEELRSQWKDLSARQSDHDKLFQALSSEGSRIQGDRNRNRAKIIDAFQVGRNAQDQLTDLDQATIEWKAENSSLLTNDDGRRIAANTELLAQYETLTNGHVVELDEIDTWRKQLEAVFPRIESAHDTHDDIAVVTDQDVLFLREILSKIRNARDTLRKHHRALHFIVASANGVDPGNQTLKQAFDHIQTDRAASFLRQLETTIRSAVDAVDAEYAGKIADERRKQREHDKEAELKAEKLETLRRKAKLEGIEHDVTRLNAIVAKHHLVQDFNRERATIESLLAPFLDLAITQPARGNPISKGGIRRPTSIGALRRTGALENTRQGLDFLYHVGGHPANMRKKGGFPSFVSMSPIPNDAVRRKVRQAQRLLIKYGDLLAERGMLSA